METKIPKIKPRVKSTDSTESLDRPSLIPKFQDKRQNSISLARKTSNLTISSSTDQLESTAADELPVRFQSTVTEQPNNNHGEGDFIARKPIRKLRHSVSMPTLKPQSNPAVSFANLYKITEIEHAVKLPLISNTRIYIRQDKINTCQTLYLFNDLVLIYPPSILIPTHNLTLQINETVNLNGIEIEFENLKDQNDFIGTVSILRNRWMKDYESNCCLVCKSKFNLFLRRHHCRGCGRLICGKCSVYNDGIRNCKECIC
ncbi:hypothetical protein HDV01_001242 [Terramyces sp. JEL0728]|nr:hypothetical protein HDV01_001242 [Terramyces sp. JEL0728]